MELGRPGWIVFLLEGHRAPSLDTMVGGTSAISEATELPAHPGGGTCDAPPGVGPMPFETPW